MTDDLQTIIIRGGLTDGVADIATIGDTLIEREDGETIEAFQIRARDAARVAGTGFVIFGGLRPLPMDDDDNTSKPK
jgi:hypothetical protein